MCVYRTPSSSLSEFNESFFPMLENNLEIFSNLIIAGDFNVDISSDRQSDADLNYINYFKSLSIFPTVILPTRVTDVSSSTVDNIWTNILKPCVSGVFNISITDHYPIFALFDPLETEIRSSVDVKFRLHNNVDMFIGRVEETMHSYVIDRQATVHDECKRFSDCLFEIYDSCFPVKNKRVSYKRLSKPWISDEVRRAIEHKHVLEKLFLRGLCQKNHVTRYRNFVNNLVRRTKKQYFNDKFNNCVQDSKKTWKYLNNLIRPNNIKKDKISLTLPCDTLISDPVEVANTFNEHFCTIGEKLDRSTPIVNSNPLSYLNRHNRSFYYAPCCAAEIKLIIDSFKNKRVNIDVIPAFIYKLMADFISPIVSDLINFSVESGAFPDVLKIARVVPLFKNGSRNILGNYRPISVLSFLSKVFEKSMHRRLSNYFDKFDLMVSNQFGFREGLSTTDAILKFVNEVNCCLESREFMVAVMIDLSKAFDTINHDILLGKLEMYGIRGMVLDWFRSYLCNRYQYVIVNGAKSSMREISMGVPQGSVLGPFLFLIYINDMHASCNLNLIHFADDTTAYNSGTHLPSLCNRINFQLAKLDDWLCCNRLSLNVSKSSYLIFSNKEITSEDAITVRGVNVKREREVKFLGVLLDDSLSFDGHINMVCSKMSKSLGVIGRTSGFLPLSTRLKLYYSLLYPYLIYALPVWGSASITRISKIKSLQRRAFKVVFNDLGYLPDLLIINRVLSFADLYQYIVLQYFFKYMINVNNYFYSYVIDFQVTHNYNSRFSLNNNLNLPTLRLSGSLNSFVFRSIKMWNSLPNTLKSCFNLHYFKVNLRAYLLLNS